MPAPIGPVPGLLIGGNAAPPPPQWSRVELPQQVQIQAADGGLSRVVNIWIVEHDNALYVLGARDGGWVKATQEAGRVNLRLGDNTYALSATPVESVDEAIFDEYTERYAADYPEIVAGMPRGAELAETGVVFRLTG